ncbi:MAG: mobilization protein [Candidatus Competibacteraceae bacterium]|nr:mobilization protein [Candidatus Competibacteraceae bacterium]
MATIEEQIEQAKQRIKQLEARKKQIEARKLHLLIKGRRSNDTRRKILAGALVLEMMEKDEAAKQRFLERLDKFLKRPDDRKLFGLPALAETESA